MQQFAISECFSLAAAATAASGGALLGATVAFKTGLNGGVLGVSGALRGTLAGPTATRAAFILGMVLAGAVASRLCEGVFEPMPPAASEAASESDQLMPLRARLFAGSFLVGLGTAFGNGCTSGHGLTGLARLSLRSWVAVPLFMCTAALAATLLGTSAALPPDPHTEASAPAWQQAASLSAATVALLAALAAAAVGVAGLLGGAEGLAKSFAELLSGAAFGCGLAISTMVRPSKVAGFLDLGSGAWDPSLMFVMGGALCVTMPFFQIMERKAEHPVLGGEFGLPPSSKPVDAQLIAGAVLFGLGWGTCGMCPGPMVVLLGANQSPEVLLSFLGLVTGMGVWVIWHKSKASGPAADNYAALRPAADCSLAK